MSVPTTYDKNIRIPTMPSGKLIDENGYATTDFQYFMQTLVSQLQLNSGNEGLVVPSQNSANVTTIQDNTVPNTSDPLSTVYTCQFGTLIYQPNTAAMPGAGNDKLLVAFNNGTDNTTPIFKTITVT